MRVDGELSPADLGYLSAADTDRFASAVMTEHKQREFERTSEADLGYTSPAWAASASTCSGSAAIGLACAGSARRCRRSRSCGCRP